MYVVAKFSKNQESYSVTVYINWEYHIISVEKFGK